MRKKDLKKRLPDLPDEYLRMVLTVVNEQRRVGYMEGVNALKSLLLDVMDIPADDIGEYVVIPDSSIDGG